MGFGSLITATRHGPDLVGLFIVYVAAPAVGLIALGVGLYYLGKRAGRKEKK